MMAWVGIVVMMARALNQTLIIVTKQLAIVHMVMAIVIGGRIGILMMDTAPLNMRIRRLISIAMQQHPHITPHVLITLQHGDFLLHMLVGIIVGGVITFMAHPTLKVAAHYI